MVVFGNVYYLSVEYWKAGDLTSLFMYPQNPSGYKSFLSELSAQAHQTIILKSSIDFEMASQIFSSYQ